MATNEMTRRGLMIGSVAAVAGLIIDRFRDPRVAVAADPNDVVLGGANVATSTTSISSPLVDTLVLAAGEGNTALRASAEGSFDSAGYAIDATSSSVAVRGRSGDDDGTGVWGDGGLVGVVGTGTTGVAGVSPAGTGVEGGSSTGVGVHAHADYGLALRCDGPVAFSSAGLATIRAGTRARTVTPGGNITSRTKVLATLQTTAGGRTTVRRVARDTVRNRITIYLTAEATVQCQVAWFVLS